MVVPYTAYEQSILVPSDSNLGPFASVDRTLDSDPQEAKAWDNFTLTSEAVIDGISRDAALGWPGAGDLVDGSRVYYYGNSLGGIQGTGQTAISPRISRAVVAVPGQYGVRPEGGTEDHGEHGDADDYVTHGREYSRSPPTKGKGPGRRRVTRRPGPGLPGYSGCAG